MVERTSKHPIFVSKKGQPKQWWRTALHSNNTAKIGTIFVIANFSSFFSSPYRIIRKGKCLLYRYIFIIFAMLIKRKIMRHFFICALAIGALLLSSCTKEQRQSIPQVRHLSYAMQGNSMYATKAIQSEDVLQVINATLPTEMNLVLTSQSTNKSTTATSGQGVVLASDTYRVIGYRGGESACYYHKGWFGLPHLPTLNQGG